MSSISATVVTRSVTSAAERFRSLSEKPMFSNTVMFGYSA